MSNDQRPLDTPRFLRGGGLAGELIGAKDWSATPLGAIAAWPRSLTGVVALMLRSPTAMVLLWGTEGVVLYNDAFAPLSGARHPAVLGATVREAWPAAAAFNAEVLRQGLAGRSLEFKGHASIELGRHHSLGPASLGQPSPEAASPEPAFFDLQYTPVDGDDGEPAGVLAVVVETTRTVLAEAWFEGESERMRRMFEQAPGFMLMLKGPEHVFEWVNPGYEQLIGRRPLLGKTIREALPEIEGQGYHELLDRVYESGEAATGAEVSVFLQGTPGAASEKRFVDFVYQPIRDPAGAVAGVFVHGFDVTARVIATRNARAAEARNRQILDSAIDYAIVAFDIDGRVTQWNEGAHRVLGWREAEMLGEHIARVFTPEDRAADRLQGEMAAALRGGVGTDDRWHVRKSGERFWATGEMTPIHDDAGHATGFVKVLRDRTDQHRAAEALAESEARLRRAQEAGRIGTFALDLATNRMTVSPEYCRLFGLEPAETLDAALTEALVLPVDRGLASNEISRGNGSAPLDAEYRVRRKSDAAVRWIARRAEYECDAEGMAARMVGTVQDITDRVAAQHAVDDSARQFRVLAEALPNHVWTATPDGALDWFNSRVYEYSGLARAQLLGSGWTAMVHPDDMTTAATLWRAALASGDPYQTEFRLRDAAGSDRWHLARALALRTEGGTVARWIGTNTDIHEQKLAQAESARDRNRIWSISQELMLVCDFAGTIASVNPTARRLLGWAEHEMVGQNLLTFLHPDDVAGATAEIAKLAAGGTTLDFENRYRTRDGGYRLLDWTAVPYDGFIHAVARDITAERAAASDLERILTTTGDLMGTLDGAGNLRSINPAWSRMLGYADPELIGRPLAAFVAREDRHLFDAAADELAATGHAVSAELRLRHRSGRRILVSWAVQPVDDMKFLVGRNVTEQRSVEEALRQSQKMEAVGQLTGGIAHDFNNLLTIIKTSIDLLRRPNLPDDRRPRFMEAIASATTRAAKLTGQLLAFSRRQTLQPVVFDAARNVAAVADMVTTLVGTRIRLEVSAAGRGCHVNADPGQFDTAIVNMAVNARDAMNEAGTLSIHTERVSGIPAMRGQPPTPGDFVAVSLTDTGSGIAPEALGRIFEPFFTTKPVGHGTGLGLSQVFGFAKQSEGDVHVSSVVGSGTTFTLYLPLAAPAVDAAEDRADGAPAAGESADSDGRAASHESEAGGAAILVVEDNADVAGTVEAILIELGYRVAVVPGAEEALALLARGAERYLAVFSDVVMRGMDGISLGREIRRLHADLPVVLSSGYSHVLASGVDPGFPLLPKPYSIDALGRSLREAIDGRQARAANAGPVR